jgi:excisionase family DNA binding protein
LATPKSPRRSAPAYVISAELSAAVEAAALAVCREMEKPQCGNCRSSLDHRLGYSIEQLCRAASIGRQTAYDEIAAGRLVAIKINRRTLIRRADAERWLESAPQIKPRSTPTDGGVVARPDQIVEGA